MAESEIVRAALKAILEDPLLQGTPLRSKKALNEVKKVLHPIQEHSSEFEIGGTGESARWRNYS